MLAKQDNEVRILLPENNIKTRLCGLWYWQFSIMTNKEEIQEPMSNQVWVKKQTNDESQTFKVI